MEYKTIYLAIIGIVGYLFWTMDFWNIFRKAELHIPAKESFKKRHISVKRFFVFLLGSFAWILITYSLTGPREPLSYVKNPIEVNDIFFVVDVSRSMLAEDFDPNRLEVAKKKILEFVKLRPTDRIGIIIFSEKVFTLLPLTTDLDLISRIISDINVGYLGSGTNIGDALGLAVARAQLSMAKNKVVILLTDGVSNVGNLTPIQAAEMAQKENIKVYTIGIGSDENAKIPVGTNFFGKQYQYIPGGSIDTKTLEEIASVTGAESYVAKDEQALREILLKIEQLERTEIESGSRVIYKELYFKYVLWGIILFLLAEIIRRFYIKEVI